MNTVAPGTVMSPTLAGYLVGTDLERPSRGTTRGRVRGDRPRLRRRRTTSAGSGCRRRWRPWSCSSARSCAASSSAPPCPSTAAPTSSERCGDRRADVEFNLADLWERVVDAVPEQRGHGLRRSPAHATPQADERATRLAHHLAGARHRRRRSRRALPVQRHRVPRGDAGRVQAAGGADQRELPLRRGGAAVPPRRRRRQGGRVPPRVRAHPRSGARHAARCSPGSSWSTTSRAPHRPSGATEYEAALDGRVIRARLRAAIARRPVHPLHRRHHRHAEGRHVARRGHLLRRVRRREPRRGDRSRSPEEIVDSPRPRTGAACPRARSCTAPPTGWRSARCTPAARSSSRPTGTSTRRGSGA